jgi:hypothetical protein
MAAYSQHYHRLKGNMFNPVMNICQLSPCYSSDSVAFLSCKPLLGRQEAAIS